MISVVVITRDEGARLASTVDQYLATLPARSEVIVVNDGSTDGSCERLPRDRRIRLVRGAGRGVAQARNAGGRAARGSVLVFSDAHLEIPKGWWKPLAARAVRPGIGGVAPAIASTTRADRIGQGLRFLEPNLEITWLWRDEVKSRRAPLIPWCCTAISRAVFNETGGFDEGMIGAGSIDNEMSLRLWLLGYELWVVPSVVIGHVFRRKPPYPANAWHSLHNRTRLALVHLEVPRIARFVRAWRNDPDFAQAMAAAATSDAMRRRKRVAAQRVHDSDWYFRKFDTRT